MKFFYTLIAAVAVMLSASAQTLDLYNGKAYNFYSPVNSQWYDIAGAQTQVIYPAADLSVMNGGLITALTFYTDQNGCSMDGGLLEIFMGETDTVSLEDFVTQGLKRVGTASMTRTDADSAQVTLTLDEPYEYKGGNLVLSTVVAVGGDYGITYFMGTVTDAFQSAATGYNTVYRLRFLPHTTFAFQDKPAAVLRGDVDGDGGVNIDDVTILIDWLLGNEHEIVPEAADCDLDGKVSISDLTSLIDYLLGKTWME